MWEITIGPWTIQTEPIFILPVLGSVIVVFGICATIYLLIGFGRIWIYTREIRDSIKIVETVIERLNKEQKGGSHEN